MASTKESNEVKSQFEGGIDTDVFAPKVASHIPRAWERRPVSAHAPRLNGMRVWKRPSDKPKPDERKYDEGMLELEREGAGERKRVRQTGARDAIADAPWDKKASREGDYAEDAVNPAQLSPVKAQPLGIIRTLGVVEPEHTVPRKRTNVNVILTPKRRSRQVTLEHFSKEVTEETDNKERAQRYKSTRKSIRRSVMPPVDLSPARTHSPQLGVFEMGDAPSPSPRKRAVQRTPTKSSETPQRSPKKLSDTPQKIVVQNSEVLENPFIEAFKEGSSTKSLRKSTRSTRASFITDNSTENSDITYDTMVPEAPQPVNKQSESIPELSEESADVAMEDSEGDSVENVTIVDERPEVAVEPSKISELSNVLMPVLEDNVAGNVVEETNASRVVEPQRFDVANAITEEIAALERVMDAVDRPSSSLSDSTLSEISTPTQESIPDLVSEQLLGEQAGQPVSDETELDSMSPIKTSEALSLISSPATAQVNLEGNEETTSSNEPQSQESNNSTESTTDYHKDDTDMLLNFLTRVKADKAAKAQQSPPHTKRKRSLPHSPLRLPLGDMDTNLSPSPKRSTSAPDFDAIVEPASPTKGSPKKTKSKRENPLSAPLPEEDTATINVNTPIRRSGRTRLPVKKDPVTGPSLIPVRRLGQDADPTVMLKRNVDKELAALTRVNTRKNKGGALTALEVLAKQAESKDNPVMRQKSLKEAFDEKEKRKAGKKAKAVAWAEELVHFQTEEKKVEEPKEKKEVKVGVRSKIAMGMGNGTPARPRKRTGKA